MIDMKIAVVGGAGFIGSHLADALLSSGHEVLVLDNLSTGSEKNVPKGAEFRPCDILRNDLAKEFAGCGAVFHLAADPSVRESASKPRSSFELNVAGTFNVLEACRKAGVKNTVFASTSAVYGNAGVIPTPESHPTFPISNYAASKLASEAYCASYAHTYGTKTTVLRFANIFGERSTHGVMFDFYNKLKKDPKKLEILGDGKQKKSYLHVSDCVSATLAAFGKQKKQFDVFNVGSREQHTVDEIAAMLSSEMGCKPKFEHTGGKQGWKGDVADMLLDVSKLESLGWKASVPFAEAVKRYVRWLKKHY